MRTIVAGNWKMHKDKAEALALLGELVKANAGQPAGVEVIVSPPYPFLDLAVNAVKGSGIQVAAQNCHAAAQGAYTGEVSVGMLKSLGVTHCIVGHSERRLHQGESDTHVAIKVRRALAEGITPIVCVGESLSEREGGMTELVVKRQLASVIHLNGHCISEIVVAYEPIWAIGTGKTATPQQAQDVHAVLRAQLRAASEHADRIRILYGGSMNAANAAQLLSQPDIDGGLIGGASLKAPDFLTIMAAAG